MNAISQIRKIRDAYEIILENGIILNVPELFVLDFDGTSGISYRNAELNISVDDITVAASLEAETQTILLNQLNDNADGVFYITSADAEHLQLPIDFCSTIYVGDTDDLDVLGGAFSGIAETTGAVAVANKADNAFVLTNRIGSVEELAAVIAHEAGLLAGTLTHDYTNNGISIDDFMNHPRVVISAGQSSTFTNETFSGLTTTSSGGVILNRGFTTINSGAAFFGISASNGGAVYNAGSATLNISGATFTGNSAEYGGAIFNYSATLNISGATFSGNRADYCGAAIFNDGSATITNATFTGNSAEEYGSAIFFNYSPTLNISGATFSENRADDTSGAIYHEGSATIPNATFNGNRIDAFEDFNNYSGGAIFNDGSATITGAKFPENYDYAFNVGGAVFNAGSTTITNATFSGNSADMGGAAIFNAGSTTIINATFSGNSAKSGAAIFNLETINLKGIADLQTDMDTWFNGWSSFVNWDLTAGTASYGTIRNFQYYSNADTSVTQKITVGNTQNSGIYTLAIGDMSDWDTDNTGKYNFNITGVSGLPDVTITIGETKTYNGLIYSLNIDNNGTPDVTTDDKLVLALDNGTTGFINTSYTGAPGSTTSDGHFVGIDAFTSIDVAIDAGKTNLIQTGGTYGNGSDVAIFTAQGKILTVQTAAYNTNTILAGGKHSNTAASRIWVYESGATNLTIDGGTFQGNIIGADVCTTGSQQRTGDVNMTIHGGNFTTTVAGGMYYRSSTHGTTWEQKLNSVNLIGNVNLMIDGGSFAKRVYGGNFASNDKWGGHTLLDGSINLTIDASDAITFKEHVIAGSRGEGCISGNVNVTVTGNGANLNFANGKYLFGASGAAYYKTSGGKRSEVSYVDGTRNLVFNDFQGQFSGKIGMFQKITFSGDTQMSFKASQNVSLSDISSWELNWDGDVETYADLTGVTNTFAGDTVNINFDSASTDDALLTGAAGAFASLTSATVKFNDTQVAFDSGANGWVSGSNKLYISDDGTQLKMTTIA